MPFPLGAVLEDSLYPCISFLFFFKYHCTCRTPAVQETQVPSLGQKDPLEKGVATHSSILAWRIPWTEEPGGLQSMGSQRVGHGWVTKHSSQPAQLNLLKTCLRGDFPGSPVAKNWPSSAGDVGSIPGWGTRSHHMPTGQLRPPTHSRAPVPQLDTHHGQINIDK